MHLYLSTGDLSGEQHAARLVAALRTRIPHLEITAMGSEILAATGAQIVVESRPLRVMGFWEVLRHLPSILKARQKVLAHLIQKRPDAVILVDFPGFHLSLAKTLRRRFPHLCLIDYIPPKLWAWQESRIKVLRQAFDLVLCILPFEESWLRERGVRAVYVGNPVVDAVRPIEGGAIRKELGLCESEQLISIFPGSRRSELTYLFPPLCDAVRHLQREGRELRFVFAAAPGFSAPMLSAMHPIPEGCPILEGRSQEILAASDLVLAKSGTTTLEAALLGTPMVVVYAANPLSAWLARRFVKLPYFSLPNLLYGKRIVPELFQEEACGERIAQEALTFLRDPTRIAAVKEAYTKLRILLGETPAAERTADTIHQFFLEKHLISPSTPSEVERSSTFSFR